MSDSDEMISDELKCFGLIQEGNPTQVQISEFSSGNMGICLLTPRDGMEPLVTSLILTPKTFSLLSNAMFQAAHNPDVWRTAKDEAPK